MKTTMYEVDVKLAVYTSYFYEGKLQNKSNYMTDDKNI